MIVLWEFLRGLIEAFFWVLMGLVLLLPAKAAVYLFRVSTPSKRVPLLADVIRVGSVLLAALFTISLGQMEGCTNCAIMLVGTLAASLAIAALGMRIDSLWKHSSFWIALSLAFVVLTLWQCRTLMLLRLEGNGWCLTLSTLGAFVFATIPLPAARLVQWAAHALLNRRARR